jgi:hypothetical protein
MGESWCINGVKNIFNSLFYGTTSFENTEILFFSNDYTPLNNCTNSDLTEIDAGGLETFTLNKITFGTSTTSVGTSTVVYIPYSVDVPLEFNLTDNIIMYGYAMRGITSNNIYYAKNVGLHSFVSGDSYTISTLQIPLDLG